MPGGARARWIRPLMVRTIMHLSDFPFACVQSDDLDVYAHTSERAGDHSSVAPPSAVSFEVRIWNDVESQHADFALAAGIHVVLSPTSKQLAVDPVALRASLASCTARLLILTQSRANDSDHPEPRVPLSVRGGLSPGTLQRVRDFVSKRLAEKIELTQLAEIAGLSICHFSRAFKQSMGVPPHRYLIRERIAAAARLIRMTNRPLVEISLEVGFSDQSHFNRIFKKTTGKNPSVYRKKLDKR